MVRGMVVWRRRRPRLLHGRALQQRLGQVTLTPDHRWPVGVPQQRPILGAVALQQRMHMPVAGERVARWVRVARPEQRLAAAVVRVVQQRGHRPVRHHRVAPDLVRRRAERRLTVAWCCCRHGQMGMRMVRLGGQRLGCGRVLRRQGRVGRGRRCRRIRTRMLAVRVRPVQQRELAAALARLRMARQRTLEAAVQQTAAVAPWETHFGTAGMPAAKGHTRHFTGSPYAPGLPVEEEEVLFEVYNRGTKKNQEVPSPGSADQTDEALNNLVLCWTVAAMASVPFGTWARTFL
uniref:Uncharacterized protein n=1 Tax=Anopheles merus TaxID=30066 RepID=A0A182UWU7_ANOME